MGTVRRIFAHLYSCARRDVLVDHDLHRNATIAYLRVAVGGVAGRFTCLREHHGADDIVR
jgi:hypothetical protein